jgi:biotin transport system substrate-specific component
MSVSLQHRTLAGALWPEADGGWMAHGLWRNAILALVGSLLLTLSAKVQIPFYPVPMTLQTLVVLLIGIAYGWRLGGATVLFYLAQGAAGLPVFAGTPEKGIGLAYMVGPTAGYLMGFVLAAVVVGRLAEAGWDRRISTTIPLMIIGNLLLYVPGLLWLGWLFGWDKPILEWGLTPFLLGDALKLALAAASLPFLWRVLKRRSETGRGGS